MPPRGPSFAEMDEFYRRQRQGGGQQNATQQTQPGFRDPSTGYINPGTLGGFIASAASTIPEFFGAEASPTAVTFRSENPWMGLASELIPYAVPFVAASALTRTARLAPTIEGFVGRIANPGTQPVRYGAARELVDVAVVDVPRLAIGSAMNPENVGELFTDIALDVGFGAAFGGGLGLFRGSGRADRELLPDVVAPEGMYASPTIQLRALEQGAPLRDPGFGVEAARARLIDDVLTETPYRGAVSNEHLPTVAPLEGVRGSADQAATESYFSLSAPSTGARRQLLAEGEPDVRLNTGEQAEIIADLQAVGAQVEDVAQLASNVVSPRLVTAVDNNGARRISEQLIENPAFQKASDNMWLAREANGGMHVALIRLPRREAAASTAEVAAEGVAPRRRLPKPYGPAKVRNGDRFLLAKTDRPGIFSKGLSATEDEQYAAWARWRQAFAEPFYTPNRFTTAQNNVIRTVSEQDYRDLLKMNRRTWVSKKSAALAQAVTKDSTVLGSDLTRAMADNLYDMIAPTMFKQARNSMYARFELTQRATIREADKSVTEVMFGRASQEGSGWQQIRNRTFEPVYPEGSIGDIIHAIPDEELPYVFMAANTRTPADDLAKLLGEGQITERTMELIRRWQTLDRKFLEGTVMPALESLGKGNPGFNMLEGHLFPAIRLGDHFQEIRDEAGRLVKVTTGKTMPQAERQAQAILDTAQESGLVWSRNARHAVEYEPSEIDKLFKETMERIGTDERADEIIRKAMLKLSYSVAGKKGGPIMTVNAPAAMTRERSGKLVTLELPTRVEMIESIKHHYERMARYAGMQQWYERWGGEIMRFQKRDPVMVEDLLRKRAQYLGVEGQITKTLNKVMEPILGPILGPKAATRIAAATNNLMYKFNLAWVNPTFAVLNALTPIMTVLPQIAFTLRASTPRAGAMMQFMPQYAGGKPIGSIGALSAPKILFQAVRDLGNPSPELKQIWQELATEGSLHPAWMDEMLAGAHDLQSTLKNQGYLAWFDRGATWMARKSEEFSRMVSANAGYRLGKDAMGLEGEQLSQFTRRFMETTNYLYSVVDRPRIFTGPVGSVFGLFKNWQMHYLGMMLQFSKAAWNEGVWSPLLYQTGAALAIGGLGATPLRHVADGLSNWYTGDPESYRQLMLQYPDMADEVWFGLPGFLGVSLQASSAIPGTDVRNEINSLTSIVAWERAKQLGQAVGAAWEHSGATADNALENPNVRDQLIAATTPRVVSRMFSTVEGDYVRSMRTGYPQVRNVSPVGAMLYGMGLNVTEIERMQIASRELYKDQEARRRMITGLGGAYAQAQLRQDYGDMEAIIQRSIMLGLPLGSVMQSSNNFVRREQQGDLLTRYGAVEQGQWNEALERMEAGQ